MSYPLGKRILFVGERDKFGGVGAIFRHQVRLLREQGFDVWTFVLCQTGAEGWFDQDFTCRVSGSRLVHKIAKYTFDIHVYSALRQVVQRVKPDWVHLHTCASTSLPVLCALAGQLVLHTTLSTELMCAISVVVHRDDLQACEGGVGLKCVQHRCVRPAFLVPHWAMHAIRNSMVRKVVRAFLAPSQNVANYLRAFDFQNVYVLPCFLPQDSYDSYPYSHEHASILCVNSLEWFKGVQFLLQAMPMVLDEVPHTTLTIVGDGSSRMVLQDMCRQMGIASQVNFVGRVPHHEISRFYGQSNVCVVPSLYETFSMVSAEAMAHGRPVVATNRGGVPELVADSERGYLVDPMDTVSLAKRIRYVLTSPGKAEALGRNGAEYVRNHLSPEAYLDRLEKVLADVL